MGFFVLLIAVICLNSSLTFSCANSNDCYATQKRPYLNFGTKSAYYFNHGIIKNTTVPNCDPVQIWFLSRHGTRNPGADEIDSMLHKLPKLQSSIVQNYENGKTKLCAKDLENLKAWKPDPTLKKEEGRYLTKQGEEDLRSIGERYKKYFPNLIRSDSADDLLKKYEFKSTNTQRTIESMTYFIKGAFGNDASSTVLPNLDNSLLEDYNMCKAWSDNVNQSNAEEAEFMSGPEVEKMMQDVSELLGFSTKLSFDDLELMHIACSFEKAWYVDKLSPWCAVFTKSNHQVFEFKEDLYHYYRSSYGSKMNTILGCRLLQDMFKRFTKLEEGGSSQVRQGVFYFSHDTMLQILLTTMGIAKDSVPLHASNYKSVQDRKWRVSHLVPFAANFAAVLYKCDSSYNVRFYLNERPLQFEGCLDGVCDWEFLKGKLGSKAFNCNLDFCWE